VDSSLFFVVLPGDTSALTIPGISWNISRRKVRIAVGVYRFDPFAHIPLVSGPVPMHVSYFTLSSELNDTSAEFNAGVPSNSHKVHFPTDGGV
jgi:hypothetical protein